MAKCGGGEGHSWQMTRIQLGLNAHPRLLQAYTSSLQSHQQSVPLASTVPFTDVIGSAMYTWAHVEHSIVFGMKRMSLIAVEHAQIPFLFFSFLVFSQFKACSDNTGTDCTRQVVMSQKAQVAVCIMSRSMTGQSAGSPCWQQPCNARSRIVDRCRRMHIACT